MRVSDVARRLGSSADCPSVQIRLRQLLPGSPLFKAATGSEQGITPGGSARSQLECFDSESENLFQRHSPRRNVRVFELGSADRCRMPEMNVRIRKYTRPCRMPLKRDDLRSARFLHGVMVRGDRHLPWIALPLCPHDPVFLVDPRSKRRPTITRQRKGLTARPIHTCSFAMLTSRSAAICASVTHESARWSGSRTFWTALRGVEPATQPGNGYRANGSSIATRITSGRQARLAYRPASQRRTNVFADTPNAARASRSSSAKPSLRLNHLILGMLFFDALCAIDSL